LCTSSMVTPILMLDGPLFYSWGFQMINYRE
jgi:hypothetical protein